MKWINNHPKYGDRKIVNTFLLFPLTINDETRWLEFTSYTMEFTDNYYRDFWKNIEWTKRV